MSNLNPDKVHSQLTWFGIDSEKTCRSWGMTEEACRARAKKYIEMHEASGPIDRWLIAHEDDIDWKGIRTRV